MGLKRHPAHVETEQRSLLLWESVLLKEMLQLSEELKRVDALLADTEFLRVNWRRGIGYV
jgi:hypothetical protein